MNLEDMIKASLDGIKEDKVKAKEKAKRDALDKEKRQREEKRQMILDRYHYLTDNIQVQKSIQQRISEDVGDGAVKASGYLLVGVVVPEFVFGNMLTGGYKEFVQWTDIKSILHLHHFALLAYDQFITKDKLVVNVMMAKMTVNGACAFLIHDEETGEALSFVTLEEGIGFIEKELQNKFNVVL